MGSARPMVSAPWVNATRARTAQVATSQPQPAGRGQHEALDDHLAHETAAAQAPERRAQRQLGTPREAPCGKKARQIHAGPIMSTQATTAIKSRKAGRPYWPGSSSRRATDAL